MDLTALTLGVALVAALLLLLPRPRWLSLKSGVLGVMWLYRKGNLLVLRLRGTDEASESAKRVISGQAWEEYCDTIKAAGTAIIAHGTPKDAASQAEGYRYLSRIVRVGLEAFIECNDTDYPVITALANGSRAARVCIGSDNPDNLYQQAMISSAHSYVVTGARGTVHYLGLGTQAGSYGKPGGLSTVDYKEASELDMAADGTLTVTLSAEEPSDPAARRNWLRLDPAVGPHVFIIRNTFIDRATEAPAALSIARVVPPAGKVAGAVTCESLEDGLSTAGMFVAAAPILFVRWANGFKKHANELPLFDQQVSNKAGGDPNIRYYHSAWALGPRECLVVDAVPPECDSWNFQINNYWMESLDYRYHVIHTNKGLATYRDGRTGIGGGTGPVRIILSHEDPGIEGTTWLSTTGHAQGTMCFRWVKPTRDGAIFPVGDTALPTPVPRVLTLDQVRALAD